MLSWGNLWRKRGSRENGFSVNDRRRAVMATTVAENNLIEEQFFLKSQIFLEKRMIYSLLLTLAEFT